MGWIESAVLMAVKCGLDQKVENEVIKNLSGNALDASAEKIKELYRKWKNQIENALSDSVMEEQNIPKDVRAYIKAEILDLLVAIDLEEVAKEVEYDVNALKTFLLREYLLGKKHVEFLSDIEKMIGVVSTKIISIVESDAQFDIKMLEILYRESRSIQNGIKSIDKKMKQIEDNTEKILEGIEKNKGTEVLQKTFVQNRYREYKDNWKKNMFLNDFDPEDENAGENIILKDMYILPDYILNANREPLSTLKERMLNAASQVEDARNQMLVILGQPGIGKSSLIAWFINNLEMELNREILVYRFTDFKELDWNAANITTKLLSALQIGFQDLSNKILFLDGFDEILVKSNREDVLNALYEALVENEAIENFSLFVTCRENYITNLFGLNCNYITLQPLNGGQIRDYYGKYSYCTNMNEEEVSLDMFVSKKDIFGIPIVLYMTLALKIEVNKESSVVDVYDRIFSMNGGIYDRINLKSGAHRIKKIKEKIRQLSKEFAVWIFQNNPEKESISKTNYINMVESKAEEEITEDVLIGNYFKIKHCEGEDAEELRFIHRSIYEYFVVDAIYSVIKEELIELTEKGKEEFAKKIIPFIQKGKITPTIGEYLKCKIRKLYNYNEEKEREFFDWLEDVLLSLVTKGFCAYVDGSEKTFLDTLTKEVNCFLNFIILLQILFDMSKNTKDYIMEGKSSPQMGQYMRIALSRDELFLGDCLKGFDLREVNLEGACLRRVNLEGTNLCGANLYGANLYGVNLKGAHLETANLEETHLERSDLRGAYLCRAYLYGAYLSRAHLEVVHLEKAYLEGAYLSQANLYGANLYGAYLSGADLRESDLHEADLREVDLYGANLCRANLREADLEGVDLSRADLRGADLCGAYLSKVNLEGANLSGAKMSEDDCDEEKRAEFEKRGVVFVKGR